MQKVPHIMMRAKSAERERASSEARPTTCLHCRVDLERAGRGPVAKYCAGACRVAAWRVRFPAKHREGQAAAARRNREAILRARPNLFRCRQCSKNFREDRSTERRLGRLPRYCSPACKHRAREDRWIAENGESRQVSWRRSLSGDKLEARRRQEREGFARRKAAARRYQRECGGAQAT